MRRVRHRFGIVHYIAHVLGSTRALEGAGGSGDGLSLQAGRQRRVVGTQVEQVVRCGLQCRVQRRRLQQALEHATGATVLQTLVRCERVLGAVPPVAELAHVQRVRLLVLILEVPLQRVVAGEGAPAVGTLLGLVDATGRGRWHAQRRRCKMMVHVLICFKGVSGFRTAKFQGKLC